MALSSASMRRRGLRTHSGRCTTARSSRWGSCGRPSTTIGFERLFNPLARLERAPFIDQLTEAVPVRPLNITAIEATNRGLADRPWAMLTSNSPVEEIGLEELAARDPETLL